MSLRHHHYDHVDNIALKEVLEELEKYLDKRYLFRTEKKYRGILGRFRYAKDRWALEEEEALKSVEKIIVLPDTHAVRGIAPDWAEHGRKELERERAEMLERLKTESFSATLLHILNEKHFDHVEIYKQARIDRKLFSKIKSNILYVPSKKTVLALALAMKMTLEETNSLLERAGFILSHSILYDMIIEFCIQKKIYDFEEINALLYMHKQPLF